MLRMSNCGLVTNGLCNRTLRTRRETMSSHHRPAQADESASVATLGSFDSASWVAEQFGEEGSLRDISLGAAPRADIHQIEESLEFHECLQCSKTFHCASSLHIHVQREHENNHRGFKCPHCGKGFTRRSEMGRHVGVRYIIRHADS